MVSTVKRLPLRHDKKWDRQAGTFRLAVAMRSDQRWTSQHRHESTGKALPPRARRDAEEEEEEEESPEAAALHGRPGTEERIMKDRKDESIENWQKRTPTSVGHAYLGIFRHFGFSRFFFLPWPSGFVRHAGSSAHGSSQPVPIQGMSTSVSSRNRRIIWAAWCWM